jgi:four helix bundle protein
MEEKKPIKSFRDLRVYNLSFDLAMEIFKITKRFPRDEQYSLTDQMRRSSRSVPANIREGFAKRKFEKIFIKHLVDAIGSSEETRTWLDFANKCEYLQNDDHERLNKGYDEITAMLFSLFNKWKSF